MKRFYLLFRTKKSYPFLNIDSNRQLVLNPETDLDRFWPKTVKFADRKKNAKTLIYGNTTCTQIFIGTEYITHIETRLIQWTQLHLIRILTICKISFYHMLYIHIHACAIGLIKKKSLVVIDTRWSLRSMLFSLLCGVSLRCLLTVCTGELSYDTLPLPSLMHVMHYMKKNHEK